MLTHISTPRACENTADSLAKCGARCARAMFFSFIDIYLDLEHFPRLKGFGENPLFDRFDNDLHDPIGMR